MNKPAYTAIPLRSSWESAQTDSLADLCGFIENGHLLIWQFHRLFYLKVEDGQYTPPAGLEHDLSKHLVRARAFNSDKEWHIWRTEAGLAGRKRWDGQGDELEAVEATMPIRGVVFEQGDWEESDATQGLLTRSYIGYNEFFQAAYTDQRFLDIKALEVPS